MPAIEAEVPGFKHSFYGFELYRGREHFGGAGMGIASADFETWRFRQWGAGTYVVPGMVMDQSFVARWDMTAR